MKKEKLKVYVSLEGIDEVIDKLETIKKLLDEINNVQLEVKFK